jgi:3-hydroxyacyl-CoA dehydrogenase / enoyl-CoA hydratase / 3-hydroxybutyryl-CoA epimerase
MTAFPYDKDADGIATVLIDMPGPVNVMNGDFTDDMLATFAALAGEPDLKGVVLASGKKSFFAGGDVKGMSAAPAEGFNAYITEAIARGRVLMRNMERLPVPVVAAINGAALGGGYELTLASNYRIAWDDPSVLIGLPEATLGLLPGGGGCVRMVKKFGIQKALPYLLSGRIVDARTALAEGLIDELAPTVGDLVPQAKAWIRANSNNPDAALQPWDRKDYLLPGGGLANPIVRGFINFNAFRLFEETQGLLPNKQLIFDVAVEALKLDLDTALQVETRALVSCIVSPVSKNMMMANFIQKNEVRRGPGRPEGFTRASVAKLGVVGTGKTAEDVASAAAAAGIAVIAIGADADMTALSACDFMVEATDGTLAQKQQVISRLSPLLTDGGIIASGSGDQPIGELAEMCDDPSRFVGLNFCAPDGGLVEVIAGALTSDETLARGFDFARQLRKTAIVVSDRPGFFVSRVTAALRAEAGAIVADGVAPVRVNNLGRALGLRTPALTEDTGVRNGHAVAMPDQDIKDRLLFSAANESLKCLEDGVLRTVAEGNIGSLLGAGAPTWTGGYIQFINSYGTDRYQQRCDQLAAHYGDRFRAPAIVAQKSAAGESFA